jgi:hypothetical protein
MTTNLEASTIRSSSSRARRPKQRLVDQFACASAGALCCPPDHADHAGHQQQHHGAVKTEMNQKLAALDADGLTIPNFLLRAK